MVSKGSGFRGVLNYVFDEGNANGKDAEAFAGNMFGETPRQLAKEFGVTRSMRPRAKETVLHFSMSLPPGEHLSKQDWMKASKTLLEGYGLDTEKNQWVAVMHNDTEHEHVHIVASRISIDGELVDTFRDFKRVHGAMREIEKEFGLAEVQSPNEKSQERKSFTRAEAKMLDVGKAPARIVLQETCSMAKEQARTLDEYIRLLEVEGIEVKLNQSQTTGRISGISYCLGGVAFKGSDLGKGFSIGSVQAALEGKENGKERQVDNGNSRERERLSGNQSSIGGARSTGVVDRTVGGDGKERSEIDANANSRLTGRDGRPPSGERETSQDHRGNNQRRVVFEAIRDTAQAIARAAESTEREARAGEADAGKDGSKRLGQGLLKDIDVEKEIAAATRWAYARGEQGYGTAPASAKESPQGAEKAKSAEQNVSDDELAAIVDANTLAEAKTSAEGMRNLRRNLGMEM